MLNLYSLLGASTVSTIKSIGNTAYKQFASVINVILPTVAGILVLLAVILGIKAGVAYAQAEDDEAKKKAKGQLINLVLGFLIAIVCVVIVMAVANSQAVAKLFQNQITKTSLGV